MTLQVGVLTQQVTPGWHTSILLRRKATQLEAGLYPPLLPTWPNNPAQGIHSPSPYLWKLPFVPLAKLHPSPLRFLPNAVWGSDHQGHMNIKPGFCMLRQSLCNCSRSPWVTHTWSKQRSALKRTAPVCFTHRRKQNLSIPSSENGLTEYSCFHTVLLRMIKSHQGLRCDTQSFQGRPLWAMPCKAPTAAQWHTSTAQAAQRASLSPRPHDNSPLAQVEEISHHTLQDLLWSHHPIELLCHVVPYEVLALLHRQLLPLPKGINVGVVKDICASSKTPGR